MRPPCAPRALPPSASQDWDGQYFTGRIPEVARTLNVVGNINEAGVIIVETTFGGRGDLNGAGTGAIMSYGDLIWTTLSRAHSAREAITIMDELCTAYGYESSGESFGVADGDEVFLLELIGKGKYGKGAVWVASRVPEGYIGATANQARTETFVQNDPANVLFAKDVISFARSIGAYNGSDAAFNFREAYDPISFSGARFGEARVFNLFNPACGGCVAAHLDFAQGYNLSNSMPLFVPVAAKLSLADAMSLMRTHFEGSWFENRGIARPDIGAGPGHSPYRFRPLTWKAAVDGHTYLNERTVGTQQSGWAFVAQSRGWLPAPIRAISWFAPDDSATSPRIPTYGCVTRIPPSFGSRTGQTPGAGVPYAPIADSWTMSLDSAFWVWNLVGNVAFAERFEEGFALILPQTLAEQARMEAAAAALEASFVDLYDPAAPAAAIELATAFVEETGEDMTARWRAFWMRLFSIFRDGTVFSTPETTQCTGGNVVNCTAKLFPVAKEEGYDEDYRTRIVHDSDNAQRYRVPDAAVEGELDVRKRGVIASKSRRRAAAAAAAAAHQ